MNSTRRVKVVGLVLVFALGGCGPSGERAEESNSSKPGDASSPSDAPQWRPLERASVSAQTPDGVSAKPSLKRAEAAAKSAKSRRDGEQFALEIAHLRADVRAPLDAQKAIQGLSSDAFARADELSLIQDMDGQRAMGSDRHYDTDLDMWIRSEVVGSESSPARINVEVVGNLVSEAFGVHSWYRNRFDVVWEDGHWQLAGYSGGTFGPDGSTNMTASERADFLPGDAWRRIPSKN